MTRRHAINLSTAIIAVLGVVLFSQGLWIQAKAMLAQILLERAFTEAVATGKPVKPWSWADTWPVARIEVPRLEVSEIALDGGSGQSLAFGPGHLAQSAEPGTRGTAVYAAHRDTHFSFLGELKNGDEIRVTGLDGLTYSYTVTGAAVVPWNRPGIDTHAAGFELALATCWPIGGTLRGPERLVVHARMQALPFRQGLLSIQPRG